ncbi:M23 family metallopeptidase [Nocardia sp. NPDC088792]|uniref:M23 family metallopeptidase n=1 Tax=Nocardia sp. NPDC088792 TaxID=3364332 RepID=UPI00381ADE4F
MTLVPRLFRAIQTAACILVFVTGIAKLLSVEWILDASSSPYGTWIWRAALLLALLFFAEWIIRLLVRRKGTTTRSEPVLIAPPFTGLWKAHNSPADNVPSHGTPWGGQSYAIDLTVVSDRAPRFGLWRLHAPAEFPSFGQPILAPADGTVVTTVDHCRDHHARTSLLGLLYFVLCEQFVRSCGPDSFAFGNNLVLELSDGTYARLCHLQQGSLLVRPGDLVRTGQPLALCGNSGRSTEPHLHFQLMNSLNTKTAYGIPFTWQGIGVPRNGEHVSVTAP